VQLVALSLILCLFLISLDYVFWFLAPLPVESIREHRTLLLPGHYAEMPPWVTAHRAGMVVQRIGRIHPQ